LIGKEVRDEGEKFGEVSKNFHIVKCTGGQAGIGDNHLLYGFMGAGEELVLAAHEIKSGI